VGDYIVLRSLTDLHEKGEATLSGLNGFLSHLSVKSLYYVRNLDKARVMWNDIPYEIRTI